MLVEHPSRDALLDEHRRDLRHEVVYLVRRFRLDDPDRLAVLATWNALVLEALHGRARELGDALTSTRRTTANGRTAWARELGW